MKKFRNRYDHEIEEIEVISETEKYVTLEAVAFDGKHRREMKRSNYMNYFDTWQEAKDFLVDREKEAIGKLERQIAQHVATLAKIEEMHR